MYKGKAGNTDISRNPQASLQECIIKTIPDAALGRAGRPVEAAIPAHKAVMGAFCSLSHCLWDRAQHRLHHGQGCGLTCDKLNKDAAYAPDVSLKAPAQAKDDLRRPAVYTLKQQQAVHTLKQQQAVPSLKHCSGNLTAATKEESQ
ncbi:MAG: hypothetical protein FRX49_08321 [Trebouxia sp. A1-2]|nr:MAG: hypothetical protein FRX49_08321 [Trebouxia sp. A1-2]